MALMIMCMSCDSEYPSLLTIVVLNALLNAVHLIFSSKTEILEQLFPCTFIPCNTKNVMTVNFNCQ